MPTPSGLASVQQRIAAIRELTTPADAVAFRQKVAAELDRTAEFEAASSAGAPGSVGARATRTPSAVRLGPTSRLAPTVTLGELRRAYGAYAPSASGTVVPQEGPTRFVLPVSGRVTSDFGPRIHPLHGDERDHHGVDIAAPLGTPVLATADGVVTYAGERGGYGLVVEVDHGGGVTSRYAHQSAVDVRVGDRVAAGQPLGRVGSTGASTGPHLHFELRVDDVPVDPASYLAGVQ